MRVQESSWRRTSSLRTVGGSKLTPASQARPNVGTFCSPTNPEKKNLHCVLPMLGLMLILTVSSAYKHTFALCDSLSLGGNLIAAGVDWERGLHCPSHLESEEKLRLINIQRLVELECSRGVKYWTSMCTHTVCNISCFLIILAQRCHCLCCLVEFTSWYLCWAYSELWLLACPELSNKHIHISLHANLHWRSMTIMFSIFGFQNSVFTCKNSHYLAPQAWCGVVSAGKRLIDRSLTWGDFGVLFACKCGSPMETFSRTPSCLVPASHGMPVDQPLSISWWFDA